MNYELHVTLDYDDPTKIYGWKHSSYNGDPQLGHGRRYYRTTYAATEQSARAMIEAAKAHWPKALRYKIEHIIYDSLEDNE